MKNNLLYIIFLSILYLTSTNGFCQIPGLGAASSFAVFASNGAIINIGSSVITGDVGNDVGAFTGFPPGIIIGTTHHTDSLTAQAAIDLSNAYSALNTLTCDDVLGVTLGNNQVLTPKVYCLLASSTLTGNLTLDGGGNPNAVFVFKVDGALAAAALSNILLINGTKPSNVYWSIGGAFSLADSAVFRGNVLADGLITLTGNAAIIGRALAVSGGINLDSNTVDISLIPVVLPVTLTSFSATGIKGGAVVKWTTVNEQNSKNFTLERSNTTHSWEVIGTLSAAGNSVQEKYYSITDNYLSKGANYYRLRSTDNNGTYSLSSVAVVYTNATTDMTVSIYPNPVMYTLTISGAEPGSMVWISDMAGRRLKEQYITGNSINHIATDKLITGIYQLSIMSPDGNITSTRLNKQ